LPLRVPRYESMRDALIAKILILILSFPAESRPAFAGRY
jgi:hypothetical protein